MRSPTAAYVLQANRWELLTPRLLNDPALSSCESGHPITNARTPPKQDVPRGPRLGGLVGSQTAPAVIQRTRNITLRSWNEIICVSLGGLLTVTSCTIRANTTQTRKSIDHRMCTRSPPHPLPTIPSIAML